MAVTVCQRIPNSCCRDFEWIIVDDGSTDNTNDLVANWLNQNLRYSIKYIKQSNQGKHIAFNTAVSQAKGEWFICVDSDDLLTEDAVFTIIDDVKTVPESCVGVVYPQDLRGASKEREWKIIDCFYIYWISSCPSGKTPFLCGWGFGLFL